MVFLSTPIVSAQMKFVTDEFEVMLRTGPSINNNIVKPLASGAPIDVLIADAGKGHSQIQTADGEIGYLLTRFISDKPSARNTVKVLAEQIQKLRSNPTEMQSELLDSADQNRLLIAENVRLTDLLHNAKTQLQKISSAAGGAINLAENNQQLETEVQQLLLQLDDIRIQNEALKDNSERVQILMTAGLIFVGLFLGWVLSISGRRERSSWGS